MTAPRETGRRFLTLNFVIRCHQVEATRTRHLLADERSLHDAAGVADLADVVRRSFPDARVTWALSWAALLDRSARYRDIRNLLTTLQRDHGDDITFLPGGFFSPVFSSRAQVRRDIDDALGRIQAMTGRTPTSIVGGFLSADAISFARERLGVRTVQGTIFSQYAVDFIDTEGSPAYPFYPSRRHSVVPGQDEGDRVDCLNLDGWTVDLVAAQLVGGDNNLGEDAPNSRLGVGPLETLFALGVDRGLREMQATTTAHFSDEHVRRNPFGWVTNTYEVSAAAFAKREAPQIADAFAAWLRWIHETWPDAACLTIAEFGDAVRARFPDNRGLAYILRQAGSGIGASFAGQEVTWFMNQRLRLAVRRTAGGPVEVIDYTDYRQPVVEPVGLGIRTWSVLGEINQKGTRAQDQPVTVQDFRTRWPAAVEEIARWHGASDEFHEVFG